MDMLPRMLQLARGYRNDTRKTTSFLSELRGVQINHRMQRYDIPNLGVLKPLMSPNEGGLDGMGGSLDVAYSQHFTWLRTSMFLTRYSIKS